MRSPPVGESAALDVFGDQILPIAEFARIVNGEDVGMIQGRSELCFALKAAAAGRIGDLRGENFDRDSSVEFRVARAVHLTHAADSEQVDNLISANRGAWVKFHDLCRGEGIICRNPGRAGRANLELLRPQLGSTEALDALWAPSEATRYSTRELDRCGARAWLEGRDRHRSS